MIKLTWICLKFHLHPHFLNKSVMIDTNISQICRFIASITFNSSCFSTPLMSCDNVDLWKRLWVDKLWTFVLKACCCSCWHWQTAVRQMLYPGPEKTLTSDLWTPENLERIEGREELGDDGRALKSTFPPSSIQTSSSFFLLSLTSNMAQVERDQLEWQVPVLVGQWWPLNSEESWGKGRQRRLTIDRSTFSVFGCQRWNLTKYFH